MSALFDEAVFREFREALGDEDTFEGLSLFLTDTADKVARLSAGEEDRARAKIEAHAIKSSAATFGFTELSQLARSLEAQAATLSPAQLRESLRELRRTFKTTREFAELNLLANAPRG